MSQSFKLAICQMRTNDDKRSNIKKAVKMIDKAADTGAQIIVLPEMFNCPYDNHCFASYAEDEQNGETLIAISEVAAKNKACIIAGSIPEVDKGSLYNTSFVFDDTGNLIGKHRKMHLFDIEIKGKITFRESDTLSSGKNITVLHTRWGKLGIAICYDVRFPELARLMALKGADVFIIPAAFNMTTGPAHWELLMKARAVDNQVYVAAASPARNINSSYIAYGNSLICDPWGTVVQRAGEEECIIVSEINLTEVERIRCQLPLLKHRRTDVYELRESSYTSEFEK